MVILNEVDHLVGTTPSSRRRRHSRSKRFFSKKRALRLNTYRREGSIIGEDDDEDNCGIVVNKNRDDGIVVMNSGHNYLSCGDNASSLFWSSCWSPNDSLLLTNPYNYDCISSSKKNSPKVVCDGCCLTNSVVVMDAVAFERNAGYSVVEVVLGSDVERNDKNGNDFNYKVASSRLSDPPNDDRNDCNVSQSPMGHRKVRISDVVEYVPYEALIEPPQKISWFSDEDLRRFKEERKAVVQHFNELFSSPSGSFLWDDDKEDSIRGLEDYTTAHLLGIATANGRVCRHRHEFKVLYEAYRQKENGRVDPDRLCAVSQRSSWTSRARAVNRALLDQVVAQLPAIETVDPKL